MNRHGETRSHTKAHHLYPDTGANTRELVERARLERRKAQGLQRSTSLTIALSTGWGVFSTVGFFASQWAGDDWSANDLFVTIAVTVVIACGVTVAWRHGAETLPRKPRVEREGLVFGFIGTMAVWCAVSIATSAVWLATPPARVSDLTKSNEFVLHRSGEIVDALREIQQLIQSLSSQREAIDEGAERERDGGGFCDSGSGLGPCFTVLQRYAVLTRGTVEALELALRQAAPLIERIADSREEIARVMDNTEIGFAQKSERVKELRDEVVAESQVLASIVPTQPLRALHDAYTADLEALGMSPVGTSRLSTMLAPATSNLGLALDQSRDISELVWPEQSDSSPFDVIFRNIDTVWPMLALAALPEAICAWLCALTFMTTRLEDDYDDKSALESAVPPRFPHRTGSHPIRTRERENESVLDSIGNGRDRDAEV